MTSIERRFRSFVAVTLAVLAVSAAVLLVNGGHAYLAADRALGDLQVFRAILVAMETLSAERGPTNSALGEDLPLTGQIRHVLEHAREASDASLRGLTDALQRQCRGCEPERASIAQAVADLKAARANVDQLIRQPRSHRGDERIEEAVDRMVAVIPLFGPVGDRFIAAIVQGVPDALNELTMTRLAATLREQAGLLGSRFTAALASHRPLTATELLSIERSRGSVAQLHALMASHAWNLSLADNRAFNQLEQTYFSEGLDYIAVVRALAQRPGGAGITTRELAERYVPLMRPITGFRDLALDRIEQQIRAQRLHEGLALLAIAGAALAIMGGLLRVLQLFQGAVIRPLSRAAQMIRSIDSNDEPTPDAFVRNGEMRALFDAIVALRTGKVERRRLEEDRDRLIAELKSMADTDPLTRLLNRRAFARGARALLAGEEASQPSGASLALVMFDIDHFKRINDTYGHAAGDLALQRIGDWCRQVWQAPALVARVGGEEFVVLQPVHDPAEAIASAQALQDRFRNSPIELDDGRALTLTASFGVCASEVPSPLDLDALLGRADHQLYLAKLAGRDRVAVDSGPAAELPPRRADTAR